MGIQDEIIKSVSYDQEEIIKNIMTLYCPKGFELDPTYSKGNFYKNIPEPDYKYDLNPEVEGVVQADCRKLPHGYNSINSIMFDPPFVAAMPRKEATGIITKRFGFYKNIYPELWDMYRDALKEFERILKPGGLLVFKCQDTIHHDHQWLSHVEIINYALSLGFYPKDLFVLIAKNRLIGKNSRKQVHCRKYHSYFLVFIKKKHPVKYWVKESNAA